MARFCDWTEANWPAALSCWLCLLVLLVAMSACAVVNPGFDVPEPRAMTLHSYPRELVRGAVAAADAVAMGTVTKVANEWEYGRLCHLPSQLMGCRAQDAWKVDVKGPRGDWQLWAFPTPGDYLPIAPGMAAIFLAQRHWLTPYAKCDQMGQLANACRQTQGEYGLQVVDTLDILPLADSALVDSLFRRTKPQ